jgi:sulfate transport system ATP-binding protein
MCEIEIINLNKEFKDYQALIDVCLHVYPNEFIALLGPSGSGKTTLLRILAGLDFPDSGRILIDGHAVDSKPVSQRNVGFVFQHYALFKHMTVRENVAFGLRVRQRKQKIPAKQIEESVTELLHLIHMENLAERYPDQLSGGQRQRVALARALAVKPKLLLLDEPFGSLDAKVRKDLRRWIRGLHEEIKLTSIFVTHDQEEAMEIADRIVVVNQGRIEQVGTPQELYERPVNSFVYDFLGNYNAFAGWRDSSEGLHLVRPEGISDLTAVKIYVRPYDMQLSKEALTANVLPMRMVHATLGGALVHVDLETHSGDIVNAEVLRETYKQLDPKPGDQLYMHATKMKTFGE